MAANFTWGFTTTAGDITAPAVAVTAPAAGAIDVGIGAVVTASFSEPMDSASMTSATFELRDAASILVPAAVTYDTATNTATLTPSSPLTNLTSYTATLLGGATGVKDVAGNALAANFTWSFTTGSGTLGTCPCSLWDSAATPANPSVADPNAVELGVKFSSDLDGFITGIRFYKGTGNTGTHVGNLWTIDGTLLATVNFTNETATGWQQVDFSSPVAITAGTVYVASYFAPNGNYAGDNAYFADAGVVNGSLQLLQDGVSGGNGVYVYSASSAFPNQTWLSSNYWVDVVFTTN